MLETSFALPQKSVSQPKPVSPKPAAVPGENTFTQVLERILAEKEHPAPKENQNSEDLQKKWGAIQENLKLSAKAEMEPEALALLSGLAWDVERILGEGVESEALLSDLTASLLAFLDQALTELQQASSLSPETRVMGEKIAFVWEGLVQDIQNNTLSLEQKTAIKELIFQTDAVSADSKAFLAKEFPDFSQDFSRKEQEAPPFKGVLPKKENAALQVKDARSFSLETKLKAQSVEAKLSQAEEPLPFSALPKFEQSIQILQKAEVSFVPRAQVENLMAQVGAQALYTLKDGGSEFRMKLTPPELGQMKVSFRLNDGIMQGKIIVSTPEAKALFEENLSLLRESMRQAGLNLGGVDVSLGQGSDFREAQDIIDKGIQYKAVRSLPPNPVELMSRGLSMSEIDYTA